MLTQRAPAQALAVPDWTRLRSLDAGASLPPAAAPPFAFEALRRVRRACRLLTLGARLLSLSAELEKVEAEIKQARAEHNAEEVAALRKEKEQLRTKEEQLRKEKLILLQRQPGALSLRVPRVHALTRVCLLADVHGAGSSNAGSERGSPPEASSALAFAPGTFV